MSEQARRDWRERFGRRSDEVSDEGAGLLPPTGLRAYPGVGQVTLHWQLVPGAIGYLVSRASSSAGPFTAVDTGGPDVQAVSGPPFCDTTAPRGRRAWYAVAALADVESGPGSRCMPVAATPRARPAPRRAGVATRRADAAAPEVTLTVAADRVAGRLHRLWRLVGSERLSQLLSTESTGGRPVAEEFADALRRARRELGVSHVRAYGILHDDLGVYREADGRPQYDFARIDAVYDRLLELGLRPVVELSFMPRDLAADPEATVFAYDAIVSPPKDWDRWEELVTRLVEHLLDRYGREEVLEWPFEVWNEPNLGVFWSGSFEEYVRLFATSARAVKAVDPGLRVGGPATAATGWIGAFLDRVAADDLPLDFVSSHTYGNWPLDLRPALRERQRADAAVWWTEWGVMTRGQPEVADSAYSAPFVLHGMKRAQEQLDRLAYWTVSDHFEELGRPTALLHGGFGLFTVGNLPKPRYSALRFAQELGDELLDTKLTGDGAGSLVDAWAARTDGGVIDVLVWNATLDHSAYRGDEALDRDMRVHVSGLPFAGYRSELARIDRAHGSLADHWARVRPEGEAWPVDDAWAELAAAAQPDVEQLGELGAEDEVRFGLPMPGVARLRLEPVRH